MINSTGSHLRDTAVRYAFVVLALAAVTLLRLAVDPYAGARYAYLFYLIVILGAALYADRRAAILAALLGAVLGNVLFTEPRGTFSYAFGDLVGLAFYTLGATATVVLADRHRRALRRATATMQDAVMQKHMLENEILQRRNVEEELRAVVSASQIAVAVATDATGRNVWVNRKFRQLVGVSDRSGALTAPDRPYTVYPAGEGAKCR